MACCGNTHSASRSSSENARNRLIDGGMDRGLAGVREGAESLPDVIVSRDVDGVSQP